MVRFINVLKQFLSLTQEAAIWQNLLLITDLGNIICQRWDGSQILHLKYLFTGRIKKKSEHLQREHNLY